MVEEAVKRAAEAIAGADALLVTAGAGMGVDSGLPDFRGDLGFWRAYPPFQRLGLSFVDLANPRWFRQDPELAWGFYGHRLGLYRRTTPHDGFRTLGRWMERTHGGGFVFTSNVDGQFQKAGFDPSRIVECHGSIHLFQCLDHCGAGLFDAGPYEVDVDETTMRARPPLPSCPRCGCLARPSILMFGDGSWDSCHTDAREQAFLSWLNSIRGRLVIVECGAGTGVPTVRWTGERLARRHSGVLVRINLREPDVPFPEPPAAPSGIAVRAGALDALQGMARVLGEA
jgi:NAD-dependent SIR2 family protein deacetylase